MKILRIIILLISISPIFAQVEDHFLFKEKTYVNEFKFEKGEVYVIFSNTEIPIPYIRRTSMYEEQKYKVKEWVNVRIYPDIDIDSKEWIMWISADDITGHFEIHVQKWKIDEPAYIDIVVKNWLRERNLLILRE